MSLHFEVCKFFLTGKRNILSLLKCNSFFNFHPKPRPNQMEMVSKNVDCSRKYDYDVCRKCGLEFPRLIAKMLYYFWSLNEAVTHLYLQAWWLSCFRLSKDLRRMAMLPRHLLKPMASESAFWRRKSFLKRNQTSYNKLAEGSTTLLIRKTSENHAVSFKTVTFDFRYMKVQLRQPLHILAGLGPHSTSERFQFHF